jgi:hypothetical protein
MWAVAVLVLIVVIVGTWLLPLRALHKYDDIDIPIPPRQP